MRKKRHKFWRENKIRIAVIGGGTIALFAMIYIGVAFYFRSHYMPKTCMNGVSIGNLKLEEAEEKLSREVSCYMLTIFGRDGDKVQILGPDFDYSYVSAGEADSILKEQNVFSWITKIGKQKDYQLSVAITYDEEKLEALIDAIPWFSEENITLPADAYLAKTEDDYEIIPEVEGNQLKKDVVKNLILDAVAEGISELTLSDAEYEAPEIKADDESLTQQLEQIETYLNTTIQYDVGEEGETLDREKIVDFIEIEDQTVSLSDRALTDYVQYLASKYNTYGDVREFATTAGGTVSIGGGDYGWVIDKEAEKEQLLSDLATGEQIEREPVFNQTAKVKSIKNDIGNTYIEIDYTNQHLYYYVEGELKVESDFVSGNINKGNGSPDGIFKIVYKKSPATLVGEDYESKVQYFMPFAYNVGIHDASWRDSFGGEIYKTSGSHGCINVPAEVAAQLYELVEKDTPVVAYYREPVTLTAENTKISNAFSYVEPEEEKEE
ncbi:MAG: peptidoglycan binding domain-containing protein [Roseburia sp.]